MSYATPADLAKRFDGNTLKDLVVDDGHPAVSLDANTNLLAALEDASGRVDAACMVSQLYSSDDLAALTGNTLGLLKRIVCEIAMAYLLGRRPEKYGSEFFKAIDERAEEYLERLRRGERLFDLAPQKEAGLPETDGPSTVDFDADHLNLITTRTQHFFPSVASRLPFNR